jgi:hypothetical protein
MSIVIDILPKTLLPLIAPASLILIGVLVEKQYVGRMSIFANSIALISFFGNFEYLPDWLSAYITCATIWGVIGLVSYMKKEDISLPEAYYVIGYIFSSIPVGLILLAFLGQHV